MSLPSIRFRPTYHEDGAVSVVWYGGLGGPGAKCEERCTNRADWVRLVVQEIVSCGPCTAHIELQNGKLYKLSDRLVTMVLEKKMIAEDLVL